MAPQALNSLYLSIRLYKSLSSCYSVVLVNTLTCKAETQATAVAVPSLQAGIQRGPSQRWRQRVSQAPSHVSSSSPPAQVTCPLEGCRTAGFWLRERSPA